jgi:hypothetical protein
MQAVNSTALPQPPTYILFQRTRYVCLHNPSANGFVFQNEPICKPLCKVHKFFHTKLIHQKILENQMGSFRRMACLMRPSPQQWCGVPPMFFRLRVEQASRLWPSVVLPPNCRAPCLPVRRSVSSSEGGSCRYRAVLPRIHGSGLSLECCDLSQPCCSPIRISGVGVPPAIPSDL